MIGQDVSRETKDRLKIYAEELRKWNPRINIVAKSTLEDLETRHFADSLQIAHLAPEVDHWVDLGSGGGFPGLVIAIHALETGSPKRVTLVESDQRKSAFLRTVIRATGASATVIAKRIEETEPLEADVLSARALAPLSALLGFAERHMTSTGSALFPKGARWKDEVAEARTEWRFECDAIRSKTDSDAVILKIEGVHPCQTS